MTGTRPPFTHFNVIQAARIKGPDVLRAYLDEDPSNLYARDPYTNVSLVIYASAFAQHGCVDLLLERGTDVQERSNLGVQSIHAAAGSRYDGSVGIIHRLMKAGAHINAQDNEGRTPMHYASYYALKDNVEAIWEYRPDLTIKDSYNRTALMALKERPRGFWTRDYDTIQTYLEDKEIELLQEENAARGVFVTYEALATSRQALLGPPTPKAHNDAMYINIVMMLLFVFMAFRGLVAGKTADTKVVEVEDKHAAVAGKQGARDLAQ